MTAPTPKSTEHDGFRGKPGAPFRPANGAEGDIFREGWCDRCQRGLACVILARTYWHAPGHPDYPREWTYDAEGLPQCTAFTPEGGQTAAD